MMERTAYPHIAKNTVPVPRRRIERGPADDRDHHEWRDRPHGDQPAPRAVDHGDPRAGWGAPGRRRRDLAGTASPRPQPPEARRAGRTVWPAPVEHRPGCVPRGPGGPGLLRRPG